MEFGAVQLVLEMQISLAQPGSVQPKVPMEKKKFEMYCIQPIRELKKVKDQLTFPINSPW